VGTGDLLTFARWGRGIGIDPALDIRHPIPRTTRLFPVDSADFFATHDLPRELGGHSLDIGLIRATGATEDILIAFRELEKAGDKDTLFIVVANRDAGQKGDPTIDLICHLTQHRPDLRLAAVTAGPTELFLIRRGIDHDNRTSPQPPRIGNNVAAVKAFLSLKPYQGWMARHRPRSGKPLRKLANAAKLVIRHLSSAFTRQFSHRGQRPRALGVLLCYNDADFLPDAIEWLAANHHDIIAWDHGSDDGTAHVLDAYQKVLVERRFIPRDFDFYRLYPAMSAHLIENYVSRYDWISWPDQDELLEGPWRDRTYYEYVTEVFNSPFDWVQFHNYNYWFTTEDNLNIATPARRVRRYGLFPDCAPRIRCWRARATNIRVFNHNPPQGRRFPLLFNLRHYPMRSEEQMLRRVTKDRADLQRGEANYHYNNMQAAVERLYIAPQELHFDDGRTNLDPDPIFNWRERVYGSQAMSPARQVVGTP
jgi:hypothetical protein